MNELNQLHQQVIFGHSHERRGSGALNTPDVTSHQVSPTCGGDVTLGVRVKDGEIEAIGWEGDGCSISQTSTPVIHDLVNGADLTIVACPEVDFDTLTHSRGKDADDAILDSLEDGIAFKGVSKYPNHVKCASLEWMAPKDALTKSGVTLPTVEPNGPEQPDHPDTTVRPARKKEEIMGNNPSGIPAVTDNLMAAQQPPAPIASTEDIDVIAVEGALHDIIDPELGINVVGLGLLYGVLIRLDGIVVFDTILTTATCPLADVTEEQAQQVLSLITDKVHIQQVWLPLWEPDKTTPEGCEQLRILGLNA